MSGGRTEALKPWTIVGVAVCLLHIFTPAVAEADQIRGYDVAYGAGRDVCTILSRTIEADVSAAPTIGTPWRPEGPLVIPWQDLGTLYQDAKRNRRWPGEAAYLIAPMFGGDREIVVVRLIVDYGSGAHPVYYTLDDVDYFRSRKWEDIAEFESADPSARNPKIGHDLSQYFFPAPEGDPLGLIPEDLRDKWLGAFSGFKDAAFVRMEGGVYMILRRRYDGLAVVYESSGARALSTACVMIPQ